MMSEPMRSTLLLPYFKNIRCNRLEIDDRFALDFFAHSLGAAERIIRLEEKTAGR
jgi:hypothetical protein